LALGLWERGTAVRIGQVTQAIKGGKKKLRRIEDGYQYVGGFPAHMWKLATADAQYKTLSHGIHTFPSRWNTLRSEIGSRMNYVSIGPGTGEKDGFVLKHLEGLASSPIVYIPVDISSDLLRMSLDVSMQGIDDTIIDVLPVELDIASDLGLEGLKKVIDLMTEIRLPTSVKTQRCSIVSPDFSPDLTTCSLWNSPPQRMPLRISPT